MLGEYVDQNSKPLGYPDVYFFNLHKEFKDWKNNDVSRRMVEIHLSKEGIWEVEPEDDLELLVEKLYVSCSLSMYTYSDHVDKADGSLIVRKMEEL